jgi:tryptophan-rich sensory protein
MNASLLFNISLLAGILLVTNIPGYFLGFKFQGNIPKKRLWFEPPGFVIPIIWIFFFIIFAYVRFSLELRNEHELAMKVLLLAFVCALYPYYTLGLEKLTGISALKFGLAGNVLVILTALMVGIQVAEFSANLSYLIYPIIIWTFFASMILLGQLRLLKSSEN